VVTGVSGSGKSTLVQNVLYPALRKAKGKSSESPGRHRRCLGADRIADVGAGRPVADRQDDRAPIRPATSAPSRPFVACSRARRWRLERGYTAGTFSFNAGNRALPHLRRQRLRTRRDAVPVRRVPAVPGLRRPAISRRGARGDADPSGTCAVDRRHARADGVRSAAALRAGRGRRTGSGAAGRGSDWSTCDWASRFRRCRAARRNG